MLESDPVEDLWWQKAWDHRCISPSQTLPESPFFLDLPPLSPSLIDSLPLVSCHDPTNESVPSKEVEDSDGTLERLIASVPGPDPCDLVVASESSVQIVALEAEPGSLNYDQWHSATLHSSVPLSFEDWVVGGPAGGFNDEYLLYHLLLGSRAESVRGGPTMATTTATTARRWATVDEDEGDPHALKSLLLECAEMAEAGNHRAGESLLAQIQQRASPIGTAQQRLAYYVSESLSTRIAGVSLRPNENLWTAPNPYAPSLPSLLECFHRFNKFTPHMTTARFIATQAILKAIEGASKVHIIELASPDHQPWTDLITNLADRRTPPPLLRITSVVLSDVVVFNATLKALVERVAKKVSEYARARRVPFTYRLFYGKLDGLCEATLRRSPDEVLVVNCMYSLHLLMDEMTEHPSPREQYLHFIHSLRPKIFIQSEVCGAYGTSFFLTRFREALSYFESYFEMLDTTCVDEEHSYAASSFLGAVLQNAIAFEGMTRVQRPQKYKQWKQMVEAVGFEQVPIDVLIREKAKGMMRRRHKDLWVGDEDNWLVMGWKGRLAHASTTWRPRANVPLGISSSRRKKRRFTHQIVPKT